ncbi:MAG: hypothetical protein M5U34_26410 [Chloroflexi bacterium]|nr:hypothetical protein [Chloroflexota bacterium]
MSLIGERPLFCWVLGREMIGGTAVVGWLVFVAWGDGGERLLSGGFVVRDGWENSRCGLVFVAWGDGENGRLASGAWLGEDADHSVRLRGCCSERPLFI